MLAAYGLRGFSSSVSRLAPVGDAAVHLVGRDLDEPAEVLRAPRGLEQHERALDVGADEISRRQDRPVDVRFGREVHDELRLLDERTADRARLRCRRGRRRVPRVVHDVVQVLAASGVGELVEGRDAPVRVLRERVADEVAADESGAAR